MTTPDDASEGSDIVPVQLPDDELENPVIGHSEPDGRQPDGLDGWLTMDEIMIKLRLESAVFKRTFPNAIEVDRGWNFIVFDRWWRFWGSKHMIFVQMNGKVEYVSYKLKWRDKGKINKDAQTDS